MGQWWERGVTSVFLFSVMCLSPGKSFSSSLCHLAYLKWLRLRSVSWSVSLCFRVTSKATSPISIRNWLSASRTLSLHCPRCADVQGCGWGAVLQLSTVARAFGASPGPLRQSPSWVSTQALHGPNSGQLCQDLESFSRWTNTPAAGCCLRTTRKQAAGLRFICCLWKLSL